MFEYARAEARALGASVLAPVHVVLGILRNGDQRAAAALTASGLELDEARRAARAEADAAGAGRAEGRHPRDAGRDGAVRPAARRRAGRGRAPAAHARWPATAASAGGMLERLGVAPDRVLAELDAAPADDADCLEA